MTNGTGHFTAKQARFVEEYFACGGNATKAAKQAGYSEKTAAAIGAENLKKPHIAAAIAKRQAEKAEELQITADDIAQELAKLAFSNMQDYMLVGNDGLPRLDLSTLTREQAAAITEVTVDTYTEGRGDHALPVKKARIKVADKRGALVDLARLLGLMPDRLEHSGPDGGPLTTRIEVEFVKPGGK